jgi:hypothetical protein
VDADQFSSLKEDEQKYWKRFRKDVYTFDEHGNVVSTNDGWDDEHVDWHALMESRSNVTLGRAKPGVTNEATRIKVAFHELGHALALYVTNSTRLQPTAISVVARARALGLVAHVPHDTREQHPNAFYEGLIRTSVASWVAERYFFGQNLPGVSGDLKNATNVALLKATQWGMDEYDVGEDKELLETYAVIGADIMSKPQASMLDPQGGAILNLINNPHTQREVSIILGMAAVDVYRIVKANEHLWLKYVPKLLELDEFVGGDLENFWKNLDEELISLDNPGNEHRTAMPPRNFKVINPLYDAKAARGEGHAIYKQVLAQLGIEEEVEA